MADDVSYLIGENEGINCRVHARNSRQLETIQPAVATGFFIGLTLGLQRNVVPVLAEGEFGIPAGSFTLLMVFIISFGFVMGVMNFVAGRLSEKVGRRRLLRWGWVAAMPIPFIFLYAPSWNWIVAANVLLGVNQGFAWSMTVTSKADITRSDQRGLATQGSMNFPVMAVSPLPV